VLLLVLVFGRGCLTAEVGMQDDKKREVVIPESLYEGKDGGRIQGSVCVE
jgi:hypothetical protein